MPNDRDDVPHVARGNQTRPRERADSTGAEGALVLLGGACTPRGHALRSFLELSGALAGAPIVVLTAASADPEESAWYWAGAFKSIGAGNVTIPMFDRADEMRDRVIAHTIDQAGGVFLGGGDQVRLVGALSGTRTASAIVSLFRRGGTVCGTSAGAAALTELTMSGGEVDEEGSLVEQYIGPGLGLLGFGAIVDTHFSERRRLQRLFLVIASNPGLFGLGIDEDTALVVRGGIGEVRGAGAVTFVDGRDTVRFDNAAELEKGRQLTLSHLRVGIVGTHYRLHLGARELLDLVVLSRGDQGVRSQSIATSRDANS
ncbi:MAG: cyanophycinase [Gemmatimonadetes bacterium]|nr:cyanophycinase [Gemmatimonadota bacterium]